MIRLLPGRTVVAALYLLVLLAATLGSGRAILELGVPSRLLDLGHVPLFAGLCLVLLWAVRGPLAPRLWAVTVFCLLFAGVNEWAQRFAVDRVPEIGDFAADVAGVGLGLAIGFGIIKGVPSGPSVARGGSSR